MSSLLISDRYNIMYMYYLSSFNEIMMTNRNIVQCNEKEQTLWLLNSSAKSMQIPANKVTIIFFRKTNVMCSWS